jgi:type IV secretory pathway VirB10-like protein
MNVNSQRSNSNFPRRMRVAAFVVGVGVLGIGSFACAKAQAKSAPDGPPLEVPAPPERVLAPTEEPVNAAAPPETPPPATAAAPRTPPPRTPPPPVRRPEPERAEPAQPQPQPAASETVAPPAAAPARELRAPSPATEKDVRDKLARVNSELSRIDYRRLNADARSQYDQSKRFTQQAEQALKDRNVVFAATLADKAEALASQLLAR